MKGEIAKNERLKEWLRENGVELAEKSGWGTPPHPMVISTETKDEEEDSGRGLIAKKNIFEGDELFSIPIELCIRKQTAIEKFGKDVIPNGMNEFIAIALVVVLERSLGEKSKWAPYIEVLPTTEEVKPTFTWSEEELEGLKGWVLQRGKSFDRYLLRSPVIAATRSLQNKLKREYQYVLDNFVTKYPDKFPTEVYTFEAFEVILSINVASVTAFQWAFTMLFSRAIRLSSLVTGEEVALIPYADLLNHNPFVTTFIDARRQRGGIFVEAKVRTRF